MGTTPCFKTKKQYLPRNKLIPKSDSPSFFEEQQQQNNLTHQSSENGQQLIQQPSQINERESIQEEDEEEENDDEYEDEYQENIQYIKGDLIQEGTDVYSALDTQNGQLLALKLFRLTEDDNIENIVNRVQSLQLLQNENIHKIIGWDYAEENDQVKENEILIVMPYESGGSISWLLQKFSKFSPHLAAIFMKQILEGLLYLHENNIYHQNLKTSNVLVDGDANIKLSDVNILNSYKLSLYSAPELFNHQQYTAASDVWSAGCIFMEMLTKRNPWINQYSTITLDRLRYFYQNNILFSYRNVIKDLAIIEILDLIFKYNPSERLTPQQLLNHTFFRDLEKDLEKNQERKEQIKSVLLSGKLHNNKQMVSQISNQSSQTLVKSKLSHSSNKIKHQQEQQLHKVMNQLNNSIIDLKQTGGRAADGTHCSLSHQDLQNVIHMKHMIGNSLKIKDKKKFKKQFSKSIDTDNTLVAEGFIRQQNKSLDKTNQMLVNQQIGQPSSNNKPPLNFNSYHKSSQSKSSNNNNLVLELKNLQTERSRYQSSGQNQDTEKQENTLYQKSNNDLDNLEQLMANQFYVKQVQSPQNLQKIEDLLMKQFETSDQYEGIKQDQKTIAEQLIGAKILNESEENNQQQSDIIFKLTGQPQIIVNHSDQIDNQEQNEVQQQQQDNKQEQKEIVNLEDLMAAQFYQKNQENQKESKNIQDIEDLLMKQFEPLDDEEEEEEIVDNQNKLEEQQKSESFIIAKKLLYSDNNNVINMKRNYEMNLKKQVIPEKLGRDADSYLIDEGYEQINLDEIKESSLKQEKESEIQQLENLICQQFYKHENNQVTHTNFQDIENMMMQQFQSDEETEKNNQDQVAIKQQQININDKNQQNQDKVELLLGLQENQFKQQESLNQQQQDTQINKDEYFNNLFNQQFNESENEDQDNGENPQDLEEIMKQQFYQNYHYPNNDHIEIVAFDELEKREQETSHNQQSVHEDDQEEEFILLL